MLGLSGAVLCLLADSGCTARRLDSEREAHMAEVPMGHAQECMYVDVGAPSSKWLSQRCACLCGRRVRLPHILEGITDSIWDGRHLNLSLQFAGPDLGDVTKIL